MKVTPEIWNGQGLFKTYQPNLFIDKYKEVARDVVKMHYPLLSMDEIDCAIDWSISRHFTDHPVKVDNNYKKQTIDMTLAGVAQYILDRQPIITSYGVMFKRHGEVPNPIYELIDGFINNRKKLKKEMFKYPKGSEQFEKYNLLQLLAKIDANGFYGLVKVVPVWSDLYSKLRELLGSLSMRDNQQLRFI